MNILSDLNSAPVFWICSIIIAFVAITCIVFIVRAYRVGIKIGMDKAKMKRTITSSATFSILPSISILLGVIALSGSLGIPWPWLRLSVIGALHYETQVAQAAAEQVGMSTLSAEEMTYSGFVTIALLMSICIIWGMVLSLFFNKRYTKKITVSRQGGGFGDMAMSAMFIGLVSAYIGSYIGGYVSSNGVFAFSGDWIPLLVVVVAGGVMALFTFIGKKERFSWVENFSIAVSMIFGMAAAAIVKLFV